MLRCCDAERLRAAGAAIRIRPDRGCTEVCWRDEDLRDFMLSDVLIHELAHHVLHVRRACVAARAARTSDHEAWADVFVRRHRARLAARTVNPR